MKLSLLFIASAAIVLSSCNTFVGIGRDFKSFGAGVENKAYGKTWQGEPRTHSFQSQQRPTAQIPQTTPPQ